MSVAGKSVAGIVLNFKRPKNIAPIVRSLAEAAPGNVFVLDQSEEERFSVKSALPDGIWYQRSANIGCIARLRLAATLPYDFYIAVDDDVFLTREQIDRMLSELASEPGIVHGIWGQKVFVSGKQLRVKNALISQDADLSILNTVYAFSRDHAVAALELAETAQLSPREAGYCDDILLSSASTGPPRCLDVGKLDVCDSYDESGIALGTDEQIQRTRAEVMVKLLKLGRLHVFPD